MVESDKRSEFTLLAVKAIELLEQKEAAKAAAKLILQGLLDILRSCKTRGVMPPFGLIDTARKLAEQFSGLDELFAKIIKTEHEIVQAISEKTGIPSDDLKNLEKLIATDPYEAAEFYFKQQSIKDMHNVINLIDKGEGIPDDVIYNQYKQTLEGTQDIRNRLAPKLAVEVVVLRQKATEPAKLDKAEKFLEKFGSEQFHAAVLRKHRDNPNKIEEIKEKRELNKILYEHQILNKDLAALLEYHLDHFVVSYNPEPLKQAIIDTKKDIKQQADRKIEAEAKKLIENKANQGAENPLQEVLQKAGIIDQKDQQDAGTRIISGVEQKDSANDTKSGKEALQDDLDAFLDDESPKAISEKLRHNLESPYPTKNIESNSTPVKQKKDQGKSRLGF